MGVKWIKYWGNKLEKLMLLKKKYAKVDGFKYKIKQVIWEESVKYE